jgi:hypothetical protein
MESVEIRAVTPEGEFVLPEDVRKSPVTFSAEMSRALTEDSFP